MRAFPESPPSAVGGDPIGAQFGNWIIDKELGRGGMGHVYLARAATESAAEHAEPRLAAVKVLAVELAQHPGFMNRFEREIQSISKLEHPNIVRFFEAGSHHDRQYYAMEYVQGQSLEDLLEERDRLSWEEVVELALQVCSALKHAHDHGIIHRDLKPTNLLLREDGVVKLADFGIAKVFDSTRLTATSAVVGTAEYMSPEQASGRPVTRRSDLYSLGIVLYRMLTGRLPFHAKSIPDMLHKHRFARFDPPRRIVPEIPRELDAIVCQLLEKDPDKRPVDAAAVRRLLEPLRRQLGFLVYRTDDELSQAKTPAIPGGVQVHPSGDQPPVVSGSLFGRLVRAEIEALNRAGPIGRFFSRVWVLVPLLIVSTALLVWGLWPKSAEELLQAAEQAVMRGDWDKAAATLDRLEKKHADHPFGPRVKELRQQIELGHLDQANPEASLEYRNEARKLYLEGVREFKNENHKAAEVRWRTVKDAFKGIRSQAQWVAAAEEGLTVVDSMEVANKESPEAASVRLRALENMYRNRQDEFGKSAHEQVHRALQHERFKKL